MTTLNMAGRVAVRYPDRLRITAEFNDVEKKWLGVCDEMDDGEYVMNAFKTKPLYGTEDDALIKTDGICKKLIEIYNELNGNKK